MTNHQLNQELKSKLAHSTKPSEIKKMGAFIPQSEPIKPNINKPIVKEQTISKNNQNNHANPQPIKEKEPLNSWFLLGVSLLGYLLMG